MVVLPAYCRGKTGKANGFRRWHVIAGRGTRRARSPTGLSHMATSDRRTNSACMVRDARFGGLLTMRV
ncbi:hypothetical protein BF49_5733 [Bradyrhizobium sp.]|nr:hypothetical protein BF49_5733 [Bradyrhizobium sp.]